MGSEALNHHLAKWNEAIRNINNHIDSVNRDIQKNKKQSNIEKRIDRLVESYKLLYNKYNKVANLDKEAVRGIKTDLVEIRKKIETVCQTGSKDPSKKHIKLETIEEPQKSKSYVAYNHNQKVVVVKDKDGIPEFICIMRDEYESDGLINRAKKIRFNKMLKKIISKSKEVLGTVTKRKIFKRIATVGMGVLMLLSGNITANQNNNHVKNEDAKHSYTNTLEEVPINNNEFVKLEKEAEETQALNESQTELGTKITKDGITKEEENTKDEYKIQIVPVKDNSEVKAEKIHIIAPANSKYTEVSDGSGNFGIFHEDTEVAIYNRALIRTNKDGTKSILRATKIGQSWKEYAEEQGINYNEFKEYIENNENIQEIISTMSVDGKKIYGWIPSSNLEYKTKISDKEMNAQRSYFTEIEDR